MDSLSRSMDDLDLFSQQQDDLATTIFADAHQLPFDTDGRIVLPEALAKHADITDRAAFVGRGAMFQIWNPEAFLRFQDEARARAKKAGATLRLRPPASGGEPA
jgi:MraZ protein